MFISRVMLAITGTAILLGALGCTNEMPPEPVRTIRYQGLELPTTRAYADIDAFKDDAPNHLSAPSFDLLEQALRGAPFGPSFSSAQAVADALEQLRVPGYGSFFADQLGAKLDDQLELVYAELPQKQLNRYIALRVGDTGSLVVVADFVAPAQPELVRVRQDSKRRLLFLSREGTVVLTRDAA